jgi:4-methyl-5(b-hydroxyethyl)-thiazole monophosphate biosynthesis
MTLLPDTTLVEVMHEKFDMMVLPGGLPGADHLNTDPRVHQLLKRLDQEGRYVAAICAAPKVLVTAGLLAGRKATSYPGAIVGMDLTQIDFQQEAVVKDGKVVTSRGPGTAMDFALELLELLVGKEKRDEVENGLVR